MLFFALLAMVLGAFVLVFLVLTVSPGFIVLFLVAALILWVIVHSYRNWAEDRAEEEDVERTRQIAGAAISVFPRKSSLKHCSTRAK